MPIMTLNLDNRHQLAAAIAGNAWVVACLCAAWCDVCRKYRPGFEELSVQHPDKHFIWIDIEDQADVVGDIDVENFPTLLIQRGDTVAFFGTVMPDPRHINRLLQANIEKTDLELRAEAAGSPQRRAWQEQCNLREWLDEVLGN